MFRAGRRLFSAASIGLLIVGVLHAIGHALAGPATAGERDVRGAMAALRLPAGLGMTPSMLDIFNGLSVTMAIALAWLGILNLAVARLDDTRGEIVRLFTIIAIAGVGGLMVLYGANQIGPPLALLAPIELMFMVSILTGRRARWR